MIVREDMNYDRRLIDSNMLFCHLFSLHLIFVIIYTLIIILFCRSYHFHTNFCFICYFSYFYYNLFWTLHTRFLTNQKFI